MLFRFVFKMGNTFFKRTLFGCKPTITRQISNSTNNFYDVIISGGGLVGGTMALGIGNSPYFKDKKILLLEAQPPPTIKLESVDTSIPYSNRVIAVSPASKKLLQKLKIWDGISRSCPVTKMQVWDACSDAMIKFDKDEIEENLCYIIENNQITSCVDKILQRNTFGNLFTKYSSRIKSCSLPRNYARDDANSQIPNVGIEMDNGDVFETSLLIAADGAQSFVAKQANMSRLSWNYNQSAVVATLKLDDSSENCQAWQRFLPTGPIAMLPLDEQHSSLVWSTSHEHALDLGNMTDDEFVNQVNDAYCQEYPRHEVIDQIGGAFKEIMKSFNNGDSRIMDSMQLPPLVGKLQSDRAKFPLGLSHCIEYVKPRLAIIGDAAHRVHPLAGQGANLGFGDVECLTKVLEKAVYNGKDIGCLSHLMKYESERQMKNIPISGALDLLKKLYSTDQFPLVFLRSLGLMGANANKFIKRQFIKQAIT